MSFLNLQQKNEEKLRKFLEFFELVICKRCWADTYHDVSRPYHTHGGLMEILGGIKTKPSIIEAWSMEIEHGLLHSFMVLYFAYCLHQEKDMLWDWAFQFNMHNPTKERLTFSDRFVASCLFHDFMRMTDDNFHDSRLKELSTEFLPVTYRHSNPLKEDEEHPLVGADRLELMRYSDHQDWCDQTVLKPYIDAYGGIELVNHFFEHIRPVFVNLFRGRKDIWISHVLEPRDDFKDNKGVDYYPKSHWFAIDERFTKNANAGTKHYVSVNVSKLSCRKCLNHTPIHHNARGMIALEDIKDLGGEIRCAPKSTAGRDHLFLYQEKPIPLKNWSIVYKEISHLKQFDQECISCISEDIFNNVFRLTEEFLNRFMCLSYST